MSISSSNPATGVILETFPAEETATIEKKIIRAHDCFHTWRDTAFSERSVLMQRAAAVLRDDAERLARAMTLEMGKPIAQARAEVEKCAWVCAHYAEHAEHILDIEILPSDASSSYARFDPLGVVLAVMPWNFPFWQVFRFAAPALMAGNTGLLKHASNVPRCALLIEEVFQKAGFPAGCFQTLLIPSSAVSTILEHPLVAAATLTGSEHAGSQVAAASGAQLKKTVLELGGNDPFIVLGDADLEAAASTAATARMINTGQSCIAAKRFIVVASVADAFLERFVKIMSGMRVGDPLDDATEVGAMAREDLLLELDAQLRTSVDMGARVLTGGRRLEGPGVFYPPTVVTDVRKGMPLYDEETFGPVAAVIVVEDEDEALHVANDSPFGLGASLWTADLTHAEMLAARIESGSVFINGLVKSDPRLPFGGIKKSGYGRELSHYGIKEFVNIKTVWIA